MVTREKIYDWLAFGIVMSVFLGLFYGMLLYKFDYPDVHISYTTKECVEVISYGDIEYTCENYPKRYNHVWVE